LTDLNEWSNSRLSTVQRCGEQYLRRYINGEDRPATLRMHAGSTVHSVAAEIHKLQLREKERAGYEGQAAPEDLLRDAIPGYQRIAELIEAAWARQMAQGVTFIGDEVNQQSVAIAKAFDAAAAGAGFYAFTVAPRTDPLHVERKVTVRPQGSRIVITGIMDLVAVDHDLQDGVRVGVQPNPPPRIVRDIKFSQKAPNRNAADESQQLSMYAMLHAVDPEGGGLPRRLVLDHIVRTPVRGDLRYVPQYTTRDARDVEALINRINVAVDAVDKGVFVPANESGAWWCSRNWCPYFSDCRFVSRRRQEEEP
jgi:hypothetical protein